MLQIPYSLYGDSKNNENLWTNAPTLGTNYAYKSLQIPTRCPTWGRWGLTMIGALAPALTDYNRFHRPSCFLNISAFPVSLYPSIYDHPAG